LDQLRAIRYVNKVVETGSLPKLRMLLMCRHHCSGAVFQDTNLE